MNDSTEPIRRQMVKNLNREQPERERFEKEHGRVWTTEELMVDFEVQGFLAPFVVVRRRSDGKKGSLMFSHSPRFFFGFQEA